MSLSYTVDSVQYFTSHSKEKTDKADSLFFPLVDTGQLEVGNHTISLTLIASVDQPLIVDYILYTPGFQTLETMSDLNGSSQIGAPGAAANEATYLPVGAIAGGTIGGAVGVALIVVGIFFLWRRRARKGVGFNSMSMVRNSPPPLQFQSGHDLPIFIPPTRHMKQSGRRPGIL